MTNCPCCEAHHKHMLRVWRGLYSCYKRELARAKKARKPKTYIRALIVLANKQVSRMKTPIGPCPLTNGAKSSVMGTVKLEGRK